MGPKKDSKGAPAGRGVKAGGGKKGATSAAEQPLSAASLQQVTETVLAALAKSKSKRKRRKRHSSRRRESSSTESSSSSSCAPSEDEGGDQPTTSSKAAHKKKTAAGHTKGGKTGVKTAAPAAEAPTSGRRKPPAKKRAVHLPVSARVAADAAAESDLTSSAAIGVVFDSPSPAQTDEAVAAAAARAADSPYNGARRQPGGETDSLEGSTPAPSRDATPRLQSATPSAANKRGKAGERASGGAKPLSYCGDVPLAHLARSFVLPSSLVEKQEMMAFTVLGETKEDPEFALLSPDRSVLPDLDKLDGFVNLSRLTQAERYSYVRRLISAAQWDLRRRHQVRMCMLVNARSRTDIFYMILRVFDIAVLVDQKTPVDNLFTQLYNYLELLFVQRWAIMRPGKLTQNDTAFYGQRAENFKKYVRYVELLFVRPQEFLAALEEILKAGLVSGQAVASRMIAKLIVEESTLKAWYAMQRRANVRADSSRRVEMDMIPDAGLNWIGSDDEEVAQVLSQYTRSHNDTRGTETPHWLDTYPFEPALAPALFTRVMHLCHSAIYRKIHTNKAQSVSARRLGLHVGEEVKCGEFITVRGADSTMAELAKQLSTLELDAASLDLASADAEHWSAKVQLVRYDDVADASTAIVLQLPISNTDEFKDFVLNVVYAKWVSGGGDDAQASAEPPPFTPTRAEVSATDNAAQLSHAPSSVPAPSAELLATAPVLARAAALSLTPTRVLSLTGRETAMWTTRSLRHFWETPLPSTRHGAKTMAFYDDSIHNLMELRERLHKELALASNGQLAHVDNDTAPTFLHEVVEVYATARPLDVVVTVADGFWQPPQATLEHYSPLLLVDARAKTIALNDVRCLAGYATVGEQRVLIAAFRPAGLYVTPHAIGPHCTVVILGCVEDDGALQQAFAAAQVQLARALCKSAVELQQAHWMGANCVALCTVSSDLEDEALNVTLPQQLLRLLYLSTINTGPPLRLSFLEEMEPSTAFLQQVYAHLDRTLLLSTVAMRSPADDAWQAKIEQEVNSAALASHGADKLDVDVQYNETTGSLALRTLLLHAREHAEAGVYLLHGKMTTEFGAASTPLLRAHQRELQAQVALRDCVEFRTLTLHGYVPLGITPSAWFFADETGEHFCYSPRKQQFWRDGVAVLREDLLTKRATNLPYM